MRKNRAFLRLLVLCLCVGGRIAVEQETRSSDASDQEQPSPASSPIAGHNWKYPRDQPRQPRLLQMQHSLSSESKFRRPFDSNYFNSAEVDEEEAAPSSGAYLERASHVRNHNNIEPGQLNVHEAQLARLHGLGPAEIAALYNWQQRVRVPPVFSRSPAGAAKRTSDAVRNVPANPANATQTPAWPKRSASAGEAKKPEKEGKARAGSGYNRKPESGKAGKQGGKSARRQQSQESVPHFDGPPASKGKDASAYEHGARAPPPDVSRINRNLATQFLLRSPRENRQYDVPIIECPPAEDGMERFACPTPDIVGRYRCIDDHVLCDGFIDCPGGEDEDGQACMFYKTMKAHLDLVADALLRWVRGR